MSTQTVDHVPGQKPLYCKCCRLIRWYINPLTKQKPGEPRIWQSVKCCDQVHFERELICPVITERTPHNNKEN